MRVLRDVRVVEAQVGDRRGVGRPLVRPAVAAAGELLLVDPVEPAVQDGRAPVRREARRLAGGDLDEPEVVPLHEGDLRAVGGEAGHSSSASSFVSRRAAFAPGS